ncbi:MAG: hypothetical protein AAF607_07485 [Pseudomonadota bacterium]
MKSLLRHKAVNGWPLFWLISLPMTGFIVADMLATDLSTGEGLSHMIGYAVRWAVPFIYLVVAASSVQILFPSPLGQWWLRNRKILGLCFAVGMFWQGLFIFMVSTFHRDYYFDDIYAFRDELEGTIGYIFLAAMVATSFQIGRKYVSSQQWKLIQKSGVYFLWAYPFSVYWWNLFYYPQLEGYTDPRVLDYIFYALGFAAFAARIAAWGKQRLKKIELPPALWQRASAGVCIALGLVGAVTGHLWYDSAYAILYGPKASADMAPWLPFWPLEPFIPLLLLGLGASIFTLQGARRPIKQAAV